MVESPPPEKDSGERTWTLLQNLSASLCDCMKGAYIPFISPMTADLHSFRTRLSDCVTAGTGLLNTPLVFDNLSDCVITGT